MELNMNTTTAPLQPNTSAGRIEYIDAMRGITMLLVVFNHVVTFCFATANKGISLNDFFTQVRMPMFFFISGFVLYKDSVVWNGKQIVKFFRKKIPVQLLSPLVFFLVYIHFMDIPFYVAAGQRFKAGYWFTYVLLEYYLIYAAVRFCFRGKWGHIIVFMVGLLLYAINWPLLYDAIPLDNYWKEVISIPKWDFFLYFVLGTLVRKNFPLVEKLLDSSWLLPCCILYYFLVNALRDMIPLNTILLERTLSLTGLVVLFAFFRNNQAVFSKQRVLGRTLQYVGRRTLDIYLIHFFLIPYRLQFVKVFTDHPMPVLEATVSFIIAAIIIAFCLVISNIIRLSPLLAHWMFGAMLPPKADKSAD